MKSENHMLNKQRETLGMYNIRIPRIDMYFFVEIWIKEETK